MDSGIQTGDPHTNRIALRLAAGLLAFCIFLEDTLSPLEGAVAVLYVVVVLLSARTFRRGDIVVAAAGSIVLTVVAYLDTHGLKNVGSPAVRMAVSLAAIGITALLAFQNQRATRTLAAQARLLNLSHDMIFVRDGAGAITFWNRAAEETYGWSSLEAVGRVADELLETHYPEQREAIESALRATGRWNGSLIQKTRSGRPIIVESRWALERDGLDHQMSVLETHTDVTARKAAHAAVIQSERRYRRMFDASRIGIVQEDWSAVRSELSSLNPSDAAALSDEIASLPDFLARIRKLTRTIDANPAFLAIVGAGSMPRVVEVLEDVLAAAARQYAVALAAFVRCEPSFECETELVRLDGQRVPVLIAITFPTPDDLDSNVLMFVVDNTERQKAQDSLLASQAELAHVARVATLGELTASIAHEVNQPLMAVVTGGEASLRWLRREPPDLQEVEVGIRRIISEGRRASDIVKRIRAFLEKAPMQQSEINVASIVDEAAALVQRELARERVELRIGIDAGLPTIFGDRIQLQQVLVNLMVNAGQAMVGQPGPRLISVSATPGERDTLTITVSDTGPGIAAGNIARLFDPFFTTKEGGMGMGLAICRSTAEAHGGRLIVDSAEGSGATFRLILPIAQEHALS